MRGTNNRTDTTPIRLRVDRFKAAARKRNWTTSRDIANALGVHEASIGRLLGTDEGGNPLQTPGTSFIAAVLRAFPDATFEDFFEVTDASALRRAS